MKPMGLESFVYMGSEPGCPCISLEEWLKNGKKEEKKMNAQKLWLRYENIEAMWIESSQTEMGEIHQLAIEFVGKETRYFNCESKEVGEELFQKMVKKLS